ncbi:MAG: acyl-CoA dehydrogenase family protein [Sphingomonadales bacterium]|nr:acyl-CoA dehydrogenase family protein [Sphingomonadales bacterium]
MMIELSELQDAAQKAFPADTLAPARDASWQLIAEMGWLMIDLPEDLGGLGLGRDATTMLHVEMGRVLSRAPLATALITQRALALSETLADKAGWLERTSTGTFVTINYDRRRITLDGRTVSGTLPAVPDADMASHVLLCTDGLIALVPLDAASVTVRERPLWDETRRLFDVTLADHAIDPALVVAEGAAADAIAATLREDMLLGIAADAIGGAAAALDATVDYLKTRRQFDRPLALFQALKHRCADLKTRIVAADALLWARAADPAATSVQFGALKALACEVFRFTTQEMIQLHGGIGLTEEHSAHLFMKRAMLDFWLAGGADVLNEAAGRAALAA